MYVLLLLNGEFSNVNEILLLDGAVGPSIALPIFCPLDMSVTERGVLKYATITVNSFIPSQSSISLPHVFGCSVVKHIYFKDICLHSELLSFCFCSTGDSTQALFLDLCL